MTAWGTAPARGRFRICGTCGAKLAFVELARTPAGQNRLLAVIRRHLESSARCHNTNTFAGGVIVACRCENPLPLQREDWLTCARCEGVIAPEVAAGESP